MDSSGNLYLTGVTESPNFPTSNPFQPSFGGGLRDGFVAKITTGVKQRNSLAAQP